jgi:hypothetical protein
MINTTISLELLHDSLYTLDALTTGLTVLSIYASDNPHQAPRLRALLYDLLEILHEC